MPVVIAKPSIVHEQAFIAMVADFEVHDPGNAGFYAEAKRGFKEYVRSLLDEEQGLNLAEGRVPETVSRDLFDPLPLFAPRLNDVMPPFYGPAAAQP